MHDDDDAQIRRLETKQGVVWEVPSPYDVNCHIGPFHFHARQVALRATWNLLDREPPTEESLEDLGLWLARELLRDSVDRAQVKWGGSQKEAYRGITDFHARTRAGQPETILERIREPGHDVVGQEPRRNLDAAIWQRRVSNTSVLWRLRHVYHLVPEYARDPLVVRALVHDALRKGATRFETSAVEVPSETLHVVMLHALMAQRRTGYPFSHQLALTSVSNRTTGKVVTSGPYKGVAAMEEEWRRRVRRNECIPIPGGLVYRPMDLSRLLEFYNVGERCADQSKATYRIHQERLHRLLLYWENARTREDHLFARMRPSFKMILRQPGKHGAEGENDGE